MAKKSEKLKTYDSGDDFPDAHEPTPEPMTDEETTPVTGLANPEPEQAVDVATAPEMMPLRVFLFLAPKKPDQMAGFEYWAKQQKLAPRTMREWKDQLEQFDKRPIG